eukprot:scaffold11395_cov21-Tisochrysis_lutea.AAC.6
MPTMPDHDHMKPAHQVARESGPNSPSQIQKRQTKKQDDRAKQDNAGKGVQHLWQLSIHATLRVQLYLRSSLPAVAITRSPIPCKLSNSFPVPALLSCTVNMLPSMFGTAVAGSDCLCVFFLAYPSKSKFMS